MRTRVRAVLLAAVVTVVLAFVALEAGVRWLVPFHNYFANNRRSIRLSEQIPEQHRTYRRDGIIPGMTGLIHVRTDADGFILPDGRDPARPVDLTLVFLGGSTTESRWVQEELRWPYLTGRHLARDLGRNVRAVNAAVTGTNLHHSLNVFVNKVMKHWPDVVVIAHTLNDCALLRDRGDYEDWMAQSSWSERSGGTLRVLYEWATSHSEFLGYLRHHYALFMIAREQASRLVPGKKSPPKPPGRAAVARDPGNPAPYADAYVVRLRMAVAMVRATGAVPVLITETARDIAATGRQDAAAYTRRSSLGGLACYRLFNDHVRRVAGEERVAMIDLEREITRPDFFYDSMHYNDQGSQRAAEIVARALLEVVPRRR